MAREDKASATSSTQDAPSGKSGDDSSLAARRARLRGTLAKQTVPPDAYSPEPYQIAAEPSQSVAVPVVTQPTVFDQPDELSPEVSPVASPKNVRSGANAGAVSDNALAIAEPEVELGQDLAADNQSIEASQPSFEVSVDSEMLDIKAVDIPEIRVPEAADLAMVITPSQIAALQTNQVADTAHQEQVIELLNTLDQQLGICSVNMAQISKAANEQLEIVRNLAETIQHQAFNEIGLSLNSLSESMSAALEPMQAVGELVPAIDNLIVTLESRNPVADIVPAIDNLIVTLESRNAEPPKTEAKLTPEELVHSLADQLSTGLIDPWTFKCAYMAVFPSEHPADLLRKLVDLLGAQRISGDFFRAAYDAVQAPDPPKPVYTLASANSGNEIVREVEVVRVVQDESVMALLEELRVQNEEMRSRMDAKDADFAELLAAKDQEVQDTQEMLNSRWEEFSGQYEKLSELVQQRNDLIQAKEVELSHKDSEITQLKTQLDEMRDQTRDMVADLQRQLTSTKAAADEAMAKPPAPKQSTSFFEQPQPTAPAAPLFTEAPKLFAEPQPQAQPQQQQQQPQQQIQQQIPAPNPVASGSHPVVDDPMQTQSPAPVDLVNAAQQGTASGSGATTLNQAMPSQAIPRPQVAAPTTPFSGATGSYGSGVRAQVFEVIVRQALAGAPWREICAGPMQVNNISADEVEAEVKRRQALLKK
ncbi:MAG: hypothetical protein QG574_917 [Cyanobacteriota bacterium erpe_2018_sw_21hr_WHONDRS-SW48-000092_B_bin.40]|nr:hypothetical protein [Cyanobacteriota bacterium erpe_2018_sw_21hr_WHONDRS-SW48-000092_B_bin.40]